MLYLSYNKSNAPQLVPAVFGAAICRVTKTYNEMSHVNSGVAPYASHTHNRRR